MKKQPKTPQEIVEIEIKSRGQGNDWRVAYLMLSELVKKPEWRLFRAEDTIFLIHNHKNEQKSVEFYIYNGDTEKELKDNLKDFFKALKISGFRIALFTPVGNHTADTIKSAHHKVDQSGNQVQVEL